MALPQRAFGIAGWRTCVTWFTAAAMLLPSVALLSPGDLDASFDAVDDPHAVREVALPTGPVPGVHSQVASVGSPLHPANHPCIPCQIIKYLSTSVLTHADTQALASGADYLAPSDLRYASPSVDFVAASPPIRAPPLRFLI